MLSNIGMMLVAVALTGVVIAALVVEWRGISLLSVLMRVPTLQCPACLTATRQPHWRRRRRGLGNAWPSADVLCPCCFHRFRVRDSA